MQHFLYVTLNTTIFCDYYVLHIIGTSVVTLVRHMSIIMQYGTLGGTWDICAQWGK